MSEKWSIYHGVKNIIVLIDTSFMLLHWPIFQDFEYHLLVYGRFKRIPINFQEFEYHLLVYSRFKRIPIFCVACCTCYPFFHFTIQNVNCHGVIVIYNCMLVTLFLVGQA